MMTGDEIRERFLAFFEGKDHLRMPSASLVPAGDPTLLFTSAGMVPFKPFFTGEQIPPSKRLTSSQKSFRTTDIDEVGDYSHLTFFEMLGNFSIGDYFKRDAIHWAWEFVTSAPDGFGLSGDSFYATIFYDDDDAYEHWVNDVGLHVDKVYRYGDRDNWWGPAGVEGPCGPCSELHYDFGPTKGCGQSLRGPLSDGIGCHPNHECDRFIELWNLVFMQYYQNTDGSRVLLPTPSVDTGMGLERAAFVMQAGENIYDTDIFRDLIRRTSEICGKKYDGNGDTEYALRVVAEHARAAAFLIADGVTPGNEGRGYVLRRVIRRAIRYGKRLGVRRNLLAQVVDFAIERSGRAYPDLISNRDFIANVVLSEEESFGQAVDRGTRILEGMVTYRKAYHRTMTVHKTQGFDILPVSSDVSAEEQLGQELAYTELIKLVNEQVEPYVYDASAVTVWSSQVSGKEAFLLWDTYGFPVEETSSITKEHDMTVDLCGFSRELETHRDVSRVAHTTTGGMEVGSLYEGLGIKRSQFVGYKQLDNRSIITAILLEGSPVSRAIDGQLVEVILDDTPFYAEAGGQVGDTGTIRGPNGVIKITDTQSPIAGLIVHKGAVGEGDVSVGACVEARVDSNRRRDISRNHSATHILHSALRTVLGVHVRQAGSLVTANRLRFDYTHISQLDTDELREIQGLVNNKIWDNLNIETQETTYIDAVEGGALAFFGDKYGDKVRVVKMDDKLIAQPFSIELCGGTHVGATGQVGSLFVLSDSSIGSGMRRLEAVTGRTSEELFVERSRILESISHKLGSPIADIEDRLEDFIKEIAELRKRTEDLERGGLKTEAQALLSRVVEIDGINILAASTSATNVDSMREMADWLKAQLRSVILVLAFANEGRVQLICTITPDLVDMGFHSGEIVSELARILGGGGGGRPEMAQAGGKHPGRLVEALGKLTEIVRRRGIS